MKKTSPILLGAMLLMLSQTAGATPQVLENVCDTDVNAPTVVTLLAGRSIDPEILKLEKIFKKDPKDINKQTAYSTAVTQAMQKMQTKNDSQQAVELGERAAALIPQNPTLMHLLGSCYLDRFCYTQDQQYYEKAKVAWGKLVKAYPNSPDAMLLLGLKNYEEGNYSAALQHFQRAFNARQSDPYTLAFAGMTLAKLNNHQQAVQGLGMAYNKLKTNPAFLATLAQEAKMVGQVDMASQRLAEAQKCQNSRLSLRTLNEIFPTKEATTIAPPNAFQATNAAQATTAVQVANASNVGSAAPNSSASTATVAGKAGSSAAPSANSTQTNAAAKSSYPAQPTAAKPLPDSAKKDIKVAKNDGKQSSASSSKKDKKKDHPKDTKIVKKTNPAANQPYRGLLPFPNQTPPALTEVVTVLMETDAGDITIEVYPQAAPNAAQRFLELVKTGFFDNTPIFRVVRQPRPFVAQFGVNWRKGHKVWQHKYFNDDPSIFQLQPGTLAFAKAGPNTNSTQIFFNYADNNFLRSQGFTTFARIIDGYRLTEKFRSVGDPGMGLDQNRLWNDGENYLKEQREKPNMIIKAQILD